MAFTGWNDAGQAATDTAAFVRTALRLTPCATMPSESYYDLRAARPIAVLDDEGETELIWPAPVLYGPPDDDDSRIYVLQGAEPSLNWTDFCRDLIGLITAERVDRILLVGSMLLDVPHRRPVVRYVHSLDAGVRRELDIVRSEYEGPVGILTVLADAARRLDLPAVSVWGCVPSYLNDDPSPKVVAALAGELAAIIGTELPIADLLASSEAWELRADRRVQQDEELTELVAQLDVEFEARSRSGGGHFAQAVESFLAREPDPRNE